MVTYRWGEMDHRNIFGYWVLLLLFYFAPVSFARSRERISRNQRRPIPHTIVAIELLTCWFGRADCSTADEPGQVPHVGGLSNFGKVSLLYIASNKCLWEPTSYEWNSMYRFTLRTNIVICTIRNNSLIIHKIFGERYSIGALQLFLLLSLVITELTIRHKRFSQEIIFDS